MAVLIPAHTGGVYISKDMGGTWTDYTVKARPGKIVSSDSTARR